MGTDVEHQDDVIEILRQELDRTYTILNSHYGTVSQLLTVAVPLIGGLVAYVYMAKNPPILILFLAPIPALGLIGIALVFLYQIQALIYFIRDVGDRIKELLGEKNFLLLYYDKESFPSRLQSIRSKNTGFHIVRLGLVGMGVILYFSLLLLSFLEIYSQNHALGSLFALVYAISLVWVWLVFYGLFVDFFVFYRAYKKGIQRQTSLWGHALALFLPRPIDFLTKSFIFVMGCVIAFLEEHVSGHPFLAQVVFAPLQVPSIGTVLLYVFIWFIVQEGLLQQGKYMWNDIRDRMRDKVIPANRARLLSKGAVAIPTFIFFLALRWGGGLLIAYLFSFQLFMLGVIILLLQILYELWAKPISNKIPVAPMFIVAIGASIRFVGGAIATGWFPIDGRLVLYALAFFALGVVSASAMWGTEAKYLLSRNLPFQRGQSSYFLSRGNYWLSVGQAVGWFVLMGVVIDGYYKWLFQASTGVWKGISVIFFVGIVLHFFVFWLLRFFREFKHTFRLFYYAWLVIMGIVIIIAWERGNGEVVVASAFSLVFVMLLKSYSRMSYKEITLQNMLENLPVLARLWFFYFFRADSGIRLVDLIKLTLLVNSEKFTLKSNQGSLA